MTKRCYVPSEGQTEEAFVNQVLAPHLESVGFVSVTPVVIETKRLISGETYRGGVNSWSQLRREILNLTKDSTALTTSMVDLYGLPTDVPGWAPAQSTSGGRARADAIEHAIAGEIDRQNFVPFVMVHEFEALLYVNPVVVAGHFDAPQLAVSLNADLSECGEPELVNDGPETAPSKRIMRHEPAYVKTSDGPTIAREIGLGALRSACPHLDGWMERVEAWASPGQRPVRHWSARPHRGSCARSCSAIGVPLLARSSDSLPCCSSRRISSNASARRAAILARAPGLATTSSRSSLNLVRTMRPILPRCVQPFQWPFRTGGSDESMLDHWCTGGFDHALRAAWTRRRAARSAPAWPAVLEAAAS